MRSVVHAHNDTGVYLADSLGGYMDRYARLLQENSAKSLNPLHTPGVDPLPKLDLLRTPYDAQHHCIAAGAKVLETQKAVFYVCACGTGKAQPLTAKVLTPGGWKFMGELKVGDAVVDPDGGVGSVTGVYPQGVKSVNRVTFTDGSFTECCDDHLWHVQSQSQRNRNGGHHVKPLKDIVSRGLFAKRSIQHDNGISAKWMIPLVSPVLFNSTGDPKVSPYLMGALLGDGCLRWQLSFTTSDQQMIDIIASELPPGMQIRSVPSSAYGYSICDGEGLRRGATNKTNRIKDAMVGFGLWRKLAHEKHIPDEYKYGSVETRTAVLQGLFDTDGSSCGTYVDFGVSSRRLAEDVLEIVRSLGGVAKIRVRKTTHRDCYRMHIRFPEGFKPFRLSRKAQKYRGGGRCYRAIRSVEPTGNAECQCISVSTKRSLYVTDDYIVTHNTLMGQAAAHLTADQFMQGKPYRAIVFCPPHLVNKWERETIDTLRNVKIIQVEHFSQLLALRGTKPTQPEWYIMSESTAKLGAGWKPAYVTRRGKGRAGVAYCPDCGRAAMDIDEETGREVPIPLEKFSRSRRFCESCGTPLFTWIQSEKWPVARYIQSKLRMQFDFLIIDEAHEEEGEVSLRSNSAGKLASCCKKVIAMTGTLLGGHANDIRTLLFRLSPTALVEDGLRWEDRTEFNERYGRIETTTTTRGGGKSKDLDTPDAKLGQGKTRTTTRKQVRPGIMYTLFGRHLMDKCIFLDLEDLAEGLPPFNETVVECDLDEEQRPAYVLVENALRAAVKEAYQKGNRTLVYSMIHALLGYPDYPNEYGEIGYWEYDDDENGGKYWVHVMTPPNLDPERIRPKEQALIDWVLREKAEGRQVWIFCEMTIKRDVVARLEKILKAAGLTVKVLRSKDASTTKREAWIAKHGPGKDVVISNAKLVQTGLDFFAKSGEFNFCSIAFYQTGYSLKVLRQAARRAYRLCQWMACRVAYFFYGETMQANAMIHMGHKLEAAEAVEGRFSEEGLVAMAEDTGSDEMALARSLVQRIDRKQATRMWSRTISQPNVDARRKQASLAIAD